MLSTPKAKGGLFLASSLCDGLEDNNIKQVATLLLNKDANPNILIPTHGVTPFHLVIGNDSAEFAEEVTKLFLCHGGDPNVRSNDGMTPVHVAAAWGRINILQLLLANGGDPLCLDNDGRSPFHYAFDGKYFKAVALLAKYCENIQDEDDEPKYNMILNKVLVSNGDIVAEYITSKDAVLTDLNSNSTPMNDPLLDFSDNKLNSSSMIVELNDMMDIHDASEIEYKISNIADAKCKTELVDVEPIDPIAMNGAAATKQNDFLRTNDKDVRNCSLVNLDFIFANLHLSDVIKKEQYLVSQIISHLSMLASDRTANETLHNCKRKDDATCSSDMSFKSKENINMSSKYRYQKYPKNFSPKLKYSRNKDILKPGTPNARKQCFKYSAQSASREKYREASDRIPLTSTCVLDNSIVSMSPNFTTPNYRKKRENANRTPLLLSHNHDDSIVSKSPNFVTPVRQGRKRDVVEKLPVDDYSKMLKISHERKNPMQYSEINWCTKYIAQSTPRRRKKYKFHSSRKRFNTCRQEDDVTTDELVTYRVLKPLNLDRTNFSETTGDTADSSLESLPFKLQKPVKMKWQNYRDRVTIKLDEEKYDEDNSRICNNGNSNSIDSSSRDVLNNSFLNNSCNQIERENESVGNFDGDKKFDTKFETNPIDNTFITIRKDIFQTEKAPKEKGHSVSNNLKFIHATESNSIRNENFVNCIDCDTKKLLNGDRNVNINNTCNLHAKNWYSNGLCKSLFCQSAVNDNSHISIVNLPVQCRKQICLPDFQRMHLSKIDKKSADIKETENISQIKSSDVCKIEKSSSALSYISTQEEYKYEDPEKGVILLERRLCVTPLNTLQSDSECEIKSKTIMSGTSSTLISQGLPRELLFIDDVTLRRELTKLGDQPGPITSTTRRIYLKRLMHLRSIANANVPVLRSNTELTNRINSHLEFGDWVHNLNTYKNLEKQVFQEFASPNPSRRWREGTSKTSFTYLLLDSRATQDLPHRSAHLTESEVWSIFLNAIFYIGKGKRSRPFAHLYDAFSTWTSMASTSTNRKIQRILDIWNNDHGVICLHVFQNIISVEAYTREAAMIDAIGKEYLENCKGGEYYGVAATWNLQQKQAFGRYLLYKALQILLFEGERQLFPQNL